LTLSCALRADCAFHDLWSIWDGPAIFVGTDDGKVCETACLLDRCTFGNNTNTAGRKMPSDSFPDSTFLGGVVAGDAVAHIGLRNATFTGTYGANVGIRDPATIAYANPPMKVFQYRPPQYVDALQMRRARALMPPDSQWVNVSDAGYRSILRVRSCCSPLQCTRSFASTSRWLLYF
jgi:hypothetical protein